jgi:branched-subunit amino acid aminotransferase/4-amino-4-deoxychorismate lyase
LLEDRPSHKGYSERIYAKINRERQFLDGLRDLCLANGYQVTGAVIRPVTYRPTDKLEYTLEKDGTLLISWSNF